MANGFAPQAQIDTSHKSILESELSLLAGKLVKIHGAYPPNAISSVAELNLSWKTIGNRHWQGLNGFPSCGFSITHAQWGNQNVLGQAIGFVPTMRFDRWRANTRWSLRLGLGVAYFTSPFHSVSNPENLVIGSDFVNMSLLKLEMSRPFARVLRYHFGLSLMHCSNAHVSVPNIGANLIAAHIGLSYSKNAHLLSKVNERNKPLRLSDSWRSGIQLMLGMHEFRGTTRPVDGPLYLVYGASAFALKSFNAKGSLSVGINYHYYNAYHDYAITQELFAANMDIKQKSQNVVLFAGYDWQFGRIAFFFQAGLNLYDPFLDELNKVWDLPQISFINRYTANKIGYKVFAFSHNGNSVLSQSTFNPYLTMAVKTNGGTADFFEVGIGTELRFVKRKRP